MKTNSDERSEAPTRPIIIDKDLSYTIVGCGLAVYRELGFGFVEPIYAKALEIELKERGVFVEREHPIDVSFRQCVVGTYRADILVERRVIIEVKSTERLSDVAKRQLRNYLSATKLELGLILHFGPRFQSHRVLGPRVIYPTSGRLRPTSSNSDA